MQWGSESDRVLKSHAFRAGKSHALAGAHARSVFTIEMLPPRPLRSLGKARSLKNSPASHYAIKTLLKCQSLSLENLIAIYRALNHTYTPWRLISPIPRMASPMNSAAEYNYAPKPPPRTHSRPNQPPPPPPLPSVPPAAATASTTTTTTTPTMTPSLPQATANIGFLSQFRTLFRPLGELPPPEPFTNKPKSYPSHRA